MHWDGNFWEENLLFNSEKNNFTIIRPTITYNTQRLQLGVLEKENWLYRALHGRAIVFSDDVFMGALASNGFPPETAAVKAIEAGINCIMISEKRISGPAKVLIEKAENDRNFAKLIDDSFRKIVEYKMKAGFFDFYLNSNGDFVLVEKNPVLQDINSRLEEFNKARLEDIDIYQTYF